MNAGTFQSCFESWQSRCESFERVLSRLVTEPVDLNTDGWLEETDDTPSVAERSALQTELSDFYSEVVTWFPKFEQEQRVAVIDLLIGHPSVIQTPVLQNDYSTEQGVRQMVMLFVLQDQWPDPRDASMQLSHLTNLALANGVDVSPILLQAANIANVKSRYGSWGSTSEILLEAHRIASTQTPTKPHPWWRFW